MQNQNFLCLDFFFRKSGIALVLGCAALCGITACQSSVAPSQRSLTEKKNLNLQPGRIAFDFDPKKVIEITLAKTDPATGENWIGTFSNQNLIWTISSAPAELAPIDRIANDTFINHLLDTLASLRLLENPMKGPPESMGLSPARFSLKWRTATAEFKFLLGTPLDHNPARRFIKLEDSPPLIASGSTLAMLDQIRSFDFLRKRTWTLLNADEVDEIELLRGGKSFFYAQREGDLWTDRAHQPIHKRAKVDVDALLTQLTGTSVDHFIDDTQKKNLIERTAFRRDYSEARLTDRLGKVTILKAAELGGIAYGINSTRPDGLFVMPKTILSEFNARK